MTLLNYLNESRFLTMGLMGGIVDGSGVLFKTLFFTCCTCCINFESIASFLASAGSVILLAVKYALFTPLQDFSSSSILFSRK